MSVTQLDIGKRVRYKTMLSGFQGQYRYGRLVDMGPSGHNARIFVDQDEINRRKPNLPPFQWILADRIEVDDRITIADLGKRVRWGDYEGKLVAVNPPRDSAMVTIERGDGSVVLDVPVWLRDLTLLPELPKHDGVLPNWQLVSEKNFPLDRPILMCNAEKQTVSVAQWYKGIGVVYWKSNGSIFSLDGITHWAEMPKLPEPPVKLDLKPKLTDVEVAKREVMTLWSNRTTTEKGSRDHRLLTTKLRKAETKLLYEIQKSGDKRAHFIKYGQAFVYREKTSLKDYSTEALADLLKNHNAVAPETRTGVMDRLLYLSQQLKLAKYKP